MKRAKGGGDPAAVEIVAYECVVFAKTNDHQNLVLALEMRREDSA
jgi:hypothetical protein